MTEETCRLAVLIDGENMPAKHAGAIFEEIANFGDAVLRRVYGNMDVGTAIGWKDILMEHSIAAYHQPPTSTNKNATDIALAIDAMDLLHSARFGGFVLVSSDSDFSKLAQRLREHGVQVWGIGDHQTNPAFRVACSRFIEVENLSVGTKDEPEKTKNVNLNQAYQRISNVLQDTNDPNGWARLSWVGHQLTQRYPDWDPRSYGERQLGGVIRKIDRFEEAEENGHRCIRIKK